ncbi:MAG: cell division topological specificity factor MinE [Candidatus Cybelea sp.]
MIEFLRRFFRQQGSSATAKERLRLVLMTDHLELAPEMVETMKRDLVDVISRFVQVDREKIDVTFERQDRTLAMLANIPILGVNRSSPNGNGVHKVEEAAPSEAPPVATPAASKPPVRKRRKRKKAQALAQAPAPLAAQ